MPLRMMYVAGILVAVVSLSAERCGRDADQMAMTPPPPPWHTIDTTFLASDYQLMVRQAGSPCARLPGADAAQAFGEPLIATPVEVKSVDMPIPLETGSACLYEVAPRNSIRRYASIQTIIDESGLMQHAVEGMKHMDSAFASVNAQRDSLIDGRWEFVSAIPGGFTAFRTGRFAVQITGPPNEPDLAVGLASRVFDKFIDVPLFDDSTRGAMPRYPVPCALLTEQEAEAELGRLIVFPYSSDRNTAIANPAGGSCAYYTKKHHALVLTQTPRHGAEMFRMKGGENITAAARAVSAAGGWDSLSVGGDGALHALKGDKMLSMQYVTASTDLRGAIKLMSLAIARF